MEEKLRFVALAGPGRFTITQLCRDFGISRKSGHKYLTRYAESGREGLCEISRRPKRSPDATDALVEVLLLGERRFHPTWDPKKLHDLLRRNHGIENPPARSTIALILSRHGLSQPRKRQPRIYRARPEHLTEPQRPNEVWTADFKGWFLLGDGQRCDPLTVCDRFSRYVLDCRACPNQQYARSQRVFAGLMRQQGKPTVMRVNNGPPFASMALGGLSRLSVWWIEQGIEVEFMGPASPQENGSHERMHRDLKAETTLPPSVNMAAQQKRFTRLRDEYNHHRPHEALDMLRPAEIYRPSSKRLSERDKMSYPSEFAVEKVSKSGHISHDGLNYYMGEVFAGCRVGWFFDEQGATQLHDSNLHLGNLTFDAEGRFRPRAYIAPPHRKPSTPPTRNHRNKSDL